MSVAGSRLALIGLLGAAVAFTGQTPPQRDGPFWIETVKGFADTPSHSTVRITTIGGVTLKGSTAGRLTYVLTKRVKAGDAGTARLLLSRFHVRTSRRGQYVYLIVEGGSGMADLEVAAPQNSGAVVIETRGGDINATQFAGIVKAETGGGRVALDQIAGEAVAKTAGGDISVGKMNSSVHCVSGGGTIRAASIGGEAFFETAGGDIEVQHVDGPVRCSTSGGGIHIVQAGNVVIADTGGGVIDVGYAKGMVTAKNSGGGLIKVGSAPSAACESSGGAIRLTNISGSLKASTAMGSIIARFQSQPVTDSFLSTGAGDITLWIPSNLKVTIRAQNATYGGQRRIVSDFPGIVVKPAGGALVAEGTLNGGGPLVRINGNGGMIYIRREEKQ